MIYVFAVLVGRASGLSSGLFGGGGGMVMVPAMVLLLGTDLIFFSDQMLKPGIRATARPPAASPAQ